MKRLLAIILLCLGGAALPACDDASNGSHVGDRDHGRIVDYGNGVYYFYATEATFANALSAFIAARPELEPVTMAGDGNGTYGRDTGYFVVFRKKQN